MRAFVIIAFSVTVISALPTRENPGLSAPINSWHYSTSFASRDAPFIAAAPGDLTQRQKARVRVAVRTAASSRANLDVSRRQPSTVVEPLNMKQYGTSHASSLLAAILCAIVGVLAFWWRATRLTKHEIHDRLPILTALACDGNLQPGSFCLYSPYTMRVAALNQIRYRHV